MMNFYRLNEISAENSNFTLPNYMSRGLPEISPDINKFNIIPIKLPYNVYKVFKIYSADNYKFRDCDNLLHRSYQSDMETQASNSELFNLKELAVYINKISKNIQEIEAADTVLKIIAELEKKMAT